MEISSIRQLKTQLNSLNKDKLTEKASKVLPAGLGFIAVQANEHGNFAPLTFMYDSIGKLVKPKEFKTLNRKNIKEYAESIGLELRKDSKAFGLRKGANGVQFDPNFYLEFEAPAEATPAEKFEKAVQAGDKAGLSMDQMLELVAAHYNVEINQIAEAA